MIVWNIEEKNILKLDPETANVRDKGILVSRR